MKAALQTAATPWAACLGASIATTDSTCGSGDWQHGVRRVLQMLDQDNTARESKIELVLVLAMLMRSVDATSHALEARVPAAIVALVTETFDGSFPANHKEILQRNCVECLFQLSHVPEGKTAIREAGAIDVLTKLLDSQDSKTVSLALHTFMGLTIDIDSKEPTLQVPSSRIRCISCCFLPCSAAPGHLLVMCRLQVYAWCTSSKAHLVLGLSCSTCAAQCFSMRQNIRKPESCSIISCHRTSRLFSWGHCKCCLSTIVTRSWCLRKYPEMAIWTPAELILDITWGPWGGAALSPGPLDPSRSHRVRQGWNPLGT